MEIHRCKRALLLLVPLLVAGMILACEPLGGLFGGREAGVPDVVINAPPNNTEVRLGETIPIRSTATDDTGVTRVELLVNYTLYASEVSPVAQGQSPFSVALNWTPQALGSHRIVVRAYNAGGNMGESVPITLIVMGEPPGPQPTQPGPQPTPPGPQPTEPGPSATQPPPQPTQPGPPPTQPPPPPPTPTPPPPTNTPLPTATQPTGPCLPSVVTNIPVGGRPKGVAGEGHRVYVGLHDVPRVVVINTDNNAVLSQLDTHATIGPGFANGVAFRNGRVYVANRDEGSVSSIDVNNPSSWKVIPAVAGGLPFGVTVAGQYVYVANFANGTVGRIDASTDTYFGSIMLPSGSGAEPSLLGALGLDVFVPTNGPGRMARIPPSGPAVEVGPSKAGYFAAAANANQRIFVTNRLFDEIIKINGNTNDVEATAQMPFTPYGIAVNLSKNRLYVVAAEANLLYVLNPATLQVVGNGVPIGAQGAQEGGQGIAVLGNRIYVSNYQAGSITVLDDSACP